MVCHSRAMTAPSRKLFRKHDWQGDCFPLSPVHAHTEQLRSGRGSHIFPNLNETIVLVVLHRFHLSSLKHEIYLTLRPLSGAWRPVRPLPVHGEAPWGPGLDRPDQGTGGSLAIDQINIFDGPGNARHSGRRNVNSTYWAALYCAGNFWSV